MSVTELDSLTVKDLEARYGIARSNVYNRLNGLKDKGYPVEPEKHGQRSIYNADQVGLMDALDAHIKQGNDIATFPSLDGDSDLSYVSRDTVKPSYRTQDSLTNIDSSVALSLVVEALAELSKERTQLLSSASKDPLANLETLDRVAEKGWQLSTSQLAPLLGLKSLSGQEIRRYGFTCKRVGKNGAESAWSIEKG